MCLTGICKYEDPCNGECDLPYRAEAPMDAYCEVTRLNCEYESFLDMLQEKIDHEQIEYEYIQSRSQ